MSTETKEQVKKQTVNTPEQEHSIADKAMDMLLNSSSLPADGSVIIVDVKEVSSEYGVSYKVDVFDPHTLLSTSMFRNQKEGEMIGKILSMYLRLNKLHTMPGAVERAAVAPYFIKEEGKERRSVSKTKVFVSRSQSLEDAIVLAGHKLPISSSTSPATEEIGY